MTPAANPYSAPQAALEGNTKSCTECGAVIRKAAEICPQCGVRQARAVSKTALLLLTFFTGGLGGHKFYLRKWVQGIFYVLFAITGIPGLIALVELVIYIFTNEERLNERYPEGSAGGAVVVVVVVFIGIAVIGILAAITIPAYSDYTVRAKVSEALVFASPVRTAVTEHYANTKTWPKTLKEIDISPDSLSDAHGNRVALLPQGVVEVAVAARQGKTILYVPTPEGERLNWDCTGGTLLPRDRPSSCRK